MATKRVRPVYILRSKGEWRAVSYRGGRILASFLTYAEARAWATKKGYRIHG